MIDRTLPISGVVEGFYGPPWSWADRRYVAEHAGVRGMTHYVWAPKDDPRHRADWAEPHDVADLAGFEALVGDGHVALGYGISPVDIDVGDPSQLGGLWAKVVTAVERGASLVLLNLDDMAPRIGLGNDHAGLVRWLHDRIDGRAQLAVMPTHHAGSTPSAYLEALIVGVPAEIPIGWSGPTVVSPTIGVADARARADVVAGRPPLLWDNAITNHGLRADRLHLGALTGREPGMRRELSGYLLNGSLQPRAGCLPLATAAAWCRGGDPQIAWEKEAHGLEVLARGCDDAAVTELVDEVLAGSPSDELRDYLGAAAVYEAPADLALEVGPWVQQLRTEAALALAALDVLDGEGDAALLMTTLLFRWPEMARAAVTVLGPRRAADLRLTQDERVRFRPAGPLFQEDANATDHLVRAALGHLHR